MFIQGEYLRRAPVMASTFRSTLVRIRKIAHPNTINTNGIQFRLKVKGKKNSAIFNTKPIYMKERKDFVHCAIQYQRVLQITTTIFLLQKKLIANN